MTKDEALRKALEALDKYGFAPCDKEEDWQGFKRAITAIKEALAQQTDEFKCPLCYDDIANIKNPSQRTWVGLTDEDKQTAIWSDGGFGAGALWAEAKLKEKNK